MTEIENLEYEIVELRQELEKKYQCIRNLKCKIDNAERKCQYMKRKKILEKYKPQLDVYVDKYIDDIVVAHPFKPELKFYTTGIYHKNLDTILERFKCLKEDGYLIYLFSINDHYDGSNQEYFVSYITFPDPRNYQ